jgi:hypothetical protein
MISCACCYLVPWVGTVNAQGCKSEVNRSVQKKWIKKTVIELKKNKGLAAMKVTEAAIQSTADFKMVSYRVYGVTKIICTNGDWICFQPHSSHDGKNAGDVCVAITGQGSIFVNYGHICGGMVHYINNKGELPSTPADFFSSYISDTDEKHWEKWK